MIVIVFFMSFSIFSALSNQTMENGSDESKKGFPFVIGGVRAQVNAFPHMAALGYGEIPKFLCGGSLINDRFVLTAAHCVQHKTLGPVRMVRLGTVSINEVNDYTLDVEVSDIILHPQFKPPSIYHDIALLKLQQPVTFADNILPARLQFDNRLDLNIERLTVAGWGKDHFLGVQQGDLFAVDLDIADVTTCQKGYSGKKYIEKLQQGVLDNIQICAGGTIGKDSCQGDSGGPLEYLNSDSRHVIVGVTSVGKACGLSPHPAIYTRVSAYFQWIRKEAFV